MRRMWLKYSGGLLQIADAPKASAMATGGGGARHPIILLFLRRLHLCPQVCGRNTPRWRSKKTGQA